MITKPKALVLYCGAGGSSMGIFLAGFDMTGVDIKPQPRYPFRFIQADALGFDLSGYDFIWASPPCQHNLYGLNAVNRKLGRVVEHHDLIPETRRRLMRVGVPYIIENVKGSALVNPVQLCGSSFGLAVRRHRLFESNYVLFVPHCRHDLQREAKYPTNFRPRGEKVLSPAVQVYGNTAGSHLWPEAMGIGWMNSMEIQQAIPPAYSLCLGEQIMQAIGYERAA